MKILAFLSAILLITACFFPWVIIETKSIVLTGIDTKGTSFGKPAYLHFLLTFLFMVSFFLKTRWSKYAAILFAAFNIAWSIRNFTIISACQMGDCPSKQVAIYLLIPATILMLIAAMLYSRDEVKNN